MNDLIARNNRDVALPALPEKMLPALESLVTALGIPRDVLAPDEEIEHAWINLPREIRDIPPDLRGELIARMCVAVSVGLFDGAINYIWNATILHLRQRIKDFGLFVVAQILEKNFEEKHLAELQDSQLLDLCLKLNLITEDGFFFLDQCRDTRNNFSAAHPCIGKINDREFIAFLNRCIHYALSNESSPRGVNITAFITAVKTARFAEGQCNVWVERLEATHDAQRQLLFGTVHGIYCDPGSSEPARLNALELCNALKHIFTADLKSDLINRHADYQAKGDTQRHGASQQFFERLGLLNLLTDLERHRLISLAIQSLWTVHLGNDNFYNEPPFAERLRDLSEQSPIPETAQEQFVQTVVCCYIGNNYGVSWAAEEHYVDMIRSFSPGEVKFMVSASTGNSLIARSIKDISWHRARFINALKLIDPSTVHQSVKAEYDHWLGRK